jgi:NDP-sugar pyrophosphorylase family protein/aminoglycoside/choline kinase family phosphotransferase
MSELDVLVLSAGFGERLRPVTYSIPKVLLPVLGRPLLYRVFDNLKKFFPRSEVYVNLHHLAEKVSKSLKEFYPEVITVYEPQILGTGGGIVNVSKISRGDNILVQNGDILTYFDFRGFYEYHKKNNFDITLAISPKVSKKNLLVKGTLFQGIKEEGHTGFAGVAIYNMELLRNMSLYTFDAKEIWEYCLRKGGRIGVFDIGDSFWVDVGTPQSYARLIRDILQKYGENVFINTTSLDLPVVEFDGFFVIEGEPRLIKGSKFRNVIIIGDPEVEFGIYENCLISPSGKTTFSEIEVFGGVGNGYETGFGGSDRKFIRVFKGSGERLVECHFGNDRESFEKHLMAYNLLLKCGIPVARIYNVDHKRNVIQMEDLGDVTLYSFLKYPPNKVFEKEFYFKGIDYLARLHALGVKEKESEYFRRWQFDYEYFLWEQNHFFNNFLERVLGVKAGNSLKECLSKIAEISASFPRVVLHRDFQSQNLMVDRMGGLRVIDFVGMRWGPKTYDLVSFLFDPYRDIGEELRESLISYYIERYKELSGNKLTREEIDKELPYIRVQRLLQALGAYGYLSRVKGKTFFEKFFFRGVQLLIDVLAHKALRCKELNELFLILKNAFLDTKDNIDYNIPIV